jgi:NADPH-dependent 2,4-dienoyl-CoA reductase/sulfur reductase-like enzyme/rhodanese-related sulfurtransferase
MAAKRVLIVGGVAGGASCAARLRRMDEAAEIVVFERGPHVSYANCGIPYHIGGVIDEEAKLLLATPELFRDRFRIDVRTRHEVLAIDAAARRVTVRDLAAGTSADEPYDALVLSPGATPVRPPLPGLDLPGVFTVRTIPDAQAIRAWIRQRNAARTVVVGGGFIGLEMAENLRHLGLAVTLIEMLPQVMPPLDPEMVAPIHAALRDNGVALALGDGLAGIETDAEGRLTVRTASGAGHRADLVVVSIGVRPDVSLARAAGLAIGDRGGIRVDAQMRTSDPNIWAVGDAVETVDRLTGSPTLLALAGPANRQGRVAADAIAGRSTRFRGVQGTSICGLFGKAIASTGLTEKALRRHGDIAFGVVYLHPNDHSGYYPGAERISLKLLFRIPDGRVLGAQAVGGNGVDKRIDVIAMAIQHDATVFDLEEAELCYAPQFGSAKDPVNLAGMIASNSLRGDLPLADWSRVGKAPLLDVRDPDEFAAGTIPGAINIPLAQLRARLDEVPATGPLDVFCGVGQRGYNAVRILRQNGRDARNLSGGYVTWTMRGAG